MGDQMLSKNNFDKSELLTLLGVAKANPQFSYGQLKRAASMTIRKYGYQWALTTKGDSKEETIYIMNLRYGIKRAVFEASEGWHSNKSMVWKRFFDYSKRLAVRLETHRIISKVRKINL